MRPLPDAAIPVLGLGAVGNLDGAHIAALDLRPRYALGIRY